MTPPTASETTQLRELGAAYERGRARIIDLVADLDPEDSATEVPACPSWSVHDVVAHVTGICADVVTGNLAGVGTDEWTAAQVDVRRPKTIAEVVEEWDDVGPRFAALIDDFPARVRFQPVADVTAHEHDIRGALGRPGERDSEGVRIGLELLVDVVLRAGIGALGLGPLEVRSGDHVFTAGTGEPTGDVDKAFGTALRSDEPVPVATAPPVGTLTVDAFDLFRALSGRRSAAQIRSFDWTIDPEPYLPVFGHGPFPMRTEDLHE